MSVPPHQDSDKAAERAKKQKEKDDAKAAERAQREKEREAKSAAKADAKAKEKADEAKRREGARERFLVYLRSQMTEVEWNVSTSTLHFRWPPAPDLSGAPPALGPTADVHVLTPRRVPGDLLRVWRRPIAHVAREHGVTVADVVDALETIAGLAPTVAAERQMDTEHDVDEPTRLVMALLFTRFDTTYRETDDRGHVHRLGREYVTLVGALGRYEDAGVVFERYDGRDVLFVRLETASGAVLKDHAEFGRRTAKQLALILQRFPGFVKRRARRGVNRGYRWWVLDVTSILDPVPGDIIVNAVPDAPSEREASSQAEPEVYS